MTRFHCLKCGDDAVYVYANDGHHFGCFGRVIPIATLCSEPTVIDESDLAPGMVVVAVDDNTPHRTGVAFLATPDAALENGYFVKAKRMVVLSHLSSARHIAGPVTP